MPPVAFDTVSVPEPFLVSAKLLAATAPDSVTATSVLTEASPVRLTALVIVVAVVT